MFKKSEKQHSQGDGSAQGTISPDAVSRIQSHAEHDFSYDDDDDGASDTGSGEETARYIADMIVALAAMAREAKLDLLAYLLNMARVEAEMQARQRETPFDED